MDAVSLIRGEIKTAHEWFEATMADVTPEQARWLPPGTAHPIGSRYAHTIVSEDMLVNALLKGDAPTFATTWAGKTGISGDPQAAFQTTHEWARSVQVDLPAARKYAAAVYAATDDYLTTLQPADLNRTVDLSEQGMGEWSQGAFLVTFVLGHVRDLMGEIACLKGLQGGKGYPF